MVLSENEVRMSSLWYDRGELETCWWLELNARTPTQTRSCKWADMSNEQNLVRCSNCRVAWKATAAVMRIERCFEGRLDRRRMKWEKATEHVRQSKSGRKTRYVNWLKAEFLWDGFSTTYKRIPCCDRPLYYRFRWQFWGHGPFQSCCWSEKCSQHRAFICCISKSRSKP